MIIVTFHHDSPNGRLFATGQIGKDDFIAVFDSHSPESGPLAILKTHIEFTNGGVLALCFSNSGDLIATIGGNDTSSSLLLYDWRKNELLASAKGINGDVFSLEFAKDDSCVYLCGKNTLKLYSVKDMSSRNAVFSPKGKIQNTYCICFTDSGDAVVGVEDGSIYMLNQNKVYFTKEAHKGAVFSIYRTQKGFVTGGKDGVVCWWMFTKNNDIKLEASLTVGSMIKALVPTADGETVYISKSNGDLQVITNKTQVSTLLSSHYGTQHKQLWGLDVIKGSNMFVTAADDGRIIVWDTDSRRTVCQVKAASVELRAVASHPSGNQIAATGKDGSLFVYRFDGSSFQDEPLVSTKDSKEEIAALKYSDNGKWLVAGSHDNFIYIYDVERDYRMYGKLTGHSSFITHIDISKGADYIRSNSGDYEVLLWSLLDKKQIHGSHIEEIEWDGISCPLSYLVRGIWKSSMQGNDINAIDVDFNNQLVAVGEDTTRVSLYNFPCTSIKPFGGQTCIGHCS